jgi:hypothetical protein
LKWLCHDIICAGAFGFALIERLKAADQKHHGHAAQPLILFDEFAQLVTIDARHENIGKDYIGRELLQLRQSVLAITNRGDFHAFIREGEVYNSLNGNGIVGE